MMTVKELVKGWYPDEQAMIEQYLDSIQPFSIEPSETHEYDGTFIERGKLIYTGVVLEEFAYVGAIRHPEAASLDSCGGQIRHPRRRG